MILVDANLLLYAVNSDLPQHVKARRWWEEALRGDQSIGLPWVVILAFLRITTNARVFERPLPVERACAYIEEWLSLPTVRAVVPGHGHWAILHSLLVQCGTGGNLTTDAHIAALALEHGYTVCSSDHDFGRFGGVRHIDPLL